jgi:hypothetical protein
LKFAVAASVVLVGGAILLARAIPDGRAAVLFSVFVLTPGIDLARAVGVQVLAPVAIVSVAVWFGIFWLAAYLVRESLGIAKAVTAARAAGILCVGAAATVAASSLNLLAPRPFAILTFPANFLLGLVSIGVPGFGLAPGPWHAWWSPLRFLSGTLAYGAMALGLLYRTRWRA